MEACALQAFQQYFTRMTVGLERLPIQFDLDAMCHLTRWWEHLAVATEALAVDSMRRSPEFLEAFGGQVHEVGAATDEYFFIRPWSQELQQFLPSCPAALVGVAVLQGKSPCVLVLQG